MMDFRRELWHQQTTDFVAVCATVNL